MAILGTYSKDGSFIRVDNGDGSISFVPVNNDNTNYQNLMKRVAAGDTIAAYVDPVVDVSAQDTAEIDTELATPGNMLRALALVMFQEINKLRVKDGDPPYTLVQFKAALKAQMR